MYITVSRNGVTLPPKHVLVKELLFFFVLSSIPSNCLGGSGASKEKLFMRAFSFFRLVFGLCEATTETIKGYGKSKICFLSHTIKELLALMG